MLRISTSMTAPARRKVSTIWTTSTTSLSLEVGKHHQSSNVLQGYVIVPHIRTLVWGRADFGQVYFALPYAEHGINAPWVWEMGMVKSPAYVSTWKSTYDVELEVCFASSWGPWMQKLKSHLLRTQNLKVLPLKPGVGQYIAIHALLTARDFFLANFYPSRPFNCFFSEASPEFAFSLDVILWLTGLEAPANRLIAFSSSPFFSVLPSPLKCWNIYRSLWHLNYTPTNLQPESCRQGIVLS